ncbi:hypothetical protein [Mesobacillus zeae]|uniref:hypothetical protein n=1 Tax=Mesobacillus zeae TaxID=1917180 RepID=UPI0030082E59
MTTKAKSGVIEFKSQKDINADRLKSTDIKYRDLQKRVDKLVKANYYTTNGDLPERKIK